MKKYKITKMCSQLLMAIAATLFSTNIIAQTCDFTVNNSGSTGGDTEYFLELDAAGNIVNVTPGPGPITISGSMPGTVVEVLHLVYDSANPPTNVPPAAGDDPTLIDGCTNDFLSARILLECLCEDEEISATYAPGGGDMLMYFLIDPATGAILDANTTGNFGTDEAVGDYLVQALSYDSANPPTTIPAIGGNISDFSADGCYNPDFLGSACCAQKIVCCPDCVAATPADLIEQACDDGDPCTVNDVESIVGCSDPVEVCVPCAGTAVDCSTAGETTVQACDDGNPCTINDEETILACDGSICVPCAGGITVDCNTAGETTVQACDDGNPCTINDEETILACDGSICVPCAGIVVDCSTAGETTVQACDDGNPCTINDEETILACDGSICVPCAGTLQDCATAGATITQACEDDDPCTMGEMEVILTCDGSICEPCSGGVAPPTCADAGAFPRN